MLASKADAQDEKMQALDEELQEVNKKVEEVKGRVKEGAKYVERLRMERAEAEKQSLQERGRGRQSCRTVRLVSFPCCVSLVPCA